MVITLLSWSIILLLAVPIGKTVIQLSGNNLFRIASKWDIYVVAGVLCLTVYAQIYSLWDGVGKTAFVVIAVIALVCMAYQFITADRIFMRERVSHVAMWQIYVLLGVAVFTALYTMKAPTHVDTYSYHAQAIRWIEEYGVVPGLGNLHNRFAYNSAYMALQALFSFRWIFTEPLHSVNGFLGWVFASYALVTNRFFTKEKSRLSDFIKFVIVIYVYVNRNNISSPGSDISAMLMVLYIMCKWCECIEYRESSQAFGIICLFAAWAVSLKLSAVTCLILVLYPLVVFIKEKQWKKLLTDLICGICIVVPWLIRNIMISGYLLYPYSKIDLFNVDWKMPAEVVDYDHREIIVWGREGKNVARYDESITQWFHTWYNNQMFRNKLFIVAGFFATSVLIVYILFKLFKMIRKGNISLALPDISKILWLIVMFAGEFFWLLSAPLVRYGMVYLMIPVAVLIYLVKEFMGEYPFRKAALAVIFLVISVIFLRNDEDFRLIMPHGYWQMENIKNEWYEFEIYSPVGDSLSGYYDFPVIPRASDLENIMPRGNKIEDGFKRK